MEEKMFKKGDLVHVPSQTRIEKFTSSNRPVEGVAKWQTFKQPKKLLVTEAESNHGYIGVYYEGNTWYVREQDVFLSEGNDE
jgi:hypothetical protein